MGARRLGPRDKITDRSMKFSNSRTLPGHDQLTRAFMVSEGILSIGRFILAPYSLMKCLLSKGMSSG
jgi:hypothetical protein